jgi:hypothetical protein
MTRVDRWPAWLVGWPGRAVVWAVATALSASLVWLGLSPVRRTAVPDRVDTGSAADLRAAEGLGAGPSLPPTPTPTTPPATTAPSPRSTATKPAARTVDGWTVVSESDGSTSYLRHFAVDGGETTIRMTPGRVFLVSATPDPGYRVDTLQPGPDRVVVRFYTASVLFTIDAIWWEGRPYAEVTRI